MYLLNMGELGSSGNRITASSAEEQHTALHEAGVLICHLRAHGSSALRPRFCRRVRMDEGIHAAPHARAVTVHGPKLHNFRQPLANAQAKRLR
jgi:hypothetical protein